MQRNSTADLAGLVAITSVLTIGLHQLGGSSDLSIDWGDPIAWMARSAPENVIGAILRHVGLTVGYYVLATVSICVATNRRHHTRRPRWVTFVTLPSVRRIVDRALAAALAVSIVATPTGPALAEQPQAPIVFEASGDGIPVPHVRISSEDEPATAPPVTPVSDAGVARVPSVVATPLPSALSTTTAVAEAHTVERGDNLWAIAAARVAEQLDSDPTTGQIRAYWRLVIDTNRDTLRSGDPDLIYPGEIVSLPAAEVTP